MLGVILTCRSSLTKFKDTKIYKKLIFALKKTEFVINFVKKSFFQINSTLI